MAINVLRDNHLFAFMDFPRIQTQAIKDYWEKKTFKENRPQLKKL